MWKDPIVEEARKVRQEYAARFGDDLKAIYDDLKATERKGGRKIVSLPPKKLKNTDKRLSALLQYGDRTFLFEQWFDSF